MDTLPIPEGLPRLLAHYSGRVQEPVRFRPSTWIRTLGDVPAARGIVQVLDEDRWALASSSKSKLGDRLIDRHQLSEVAAKTSLADDRELLTLFLLVQVWGTGTSGNRTLRHTRTAFGDPAALLRSLRSTAGKLRAAETDTSPLETAYREWNVGGVGRSFFTKWFAFVGRVEGRAWQPLILDDRVFATLNETLDVKTSAMAASSNRARRYRAYVEHMHAWTAELATEPTTADVDAERLEWVLFRHNGEAPIAK